MLEQCCAHVRVISDHLFIYGCQKSLCTPQRVELQFHAVLNFTSDGSQLHSFVTLPLGKDPSDPYSYNKTNEMY